MNSLKNKKVLVTGGASGIGKAITLELAGLGADIMIHCYSSCNEALELVKLIEKKGNKVFVFQADLTIEEEIKKLAAFTNEKFGLLDILINNTGDMIKRTNLENITENYIDKVFSVNYKSMVLLIKETLPLLKRTIDGAAIINLSSLAGKNGGGKGALVYASSKGAIMTFTKGLAAELAQFNIRVNCICPGLILGSKFHDVHTSAAVKERTIKSIPLGRAGACEDVARAAAFLASEYNGFITGTSLDINGGVYA